MRAAKAEGLAPSLIDKEDFGKLAEFDALFIRETTSVNHHTFRFASRAEAEGLVVIDDPISILRCTNKVYQAELFLRHGIPSPRSMIVHRDNRNHLFERLGSPCVLKRPDSSFSQGVVMAATETELREHLESFFDNHAEWDLAGWMQQHLQGIDSRLMWEYGPGANRGHRLIITPEGEHHLRPLVQPGKRPDLRLRSIPLAAAFLSACAQIPCSLHASPQKFAAFYRPSDAAVPEFPTRAPGAAIGIISVCC
jgi:hypothetical protein